MIPSLLAAAVAATLPVAAAANEPQADPAASADADEAPPLEPGDEVVVTARRRAEQLQDVPIAVSVIESGRLDATGTTNVNRLVQFLPQVNFFSSNPRNSAINIRGLGAPFGLTNDGIEQGVGFYIDGVYYSRPASASFDFVDIERIEVLRGPQGTLFGKNTTAGAINITTRRPGFEPEGRLEVSFGNYSFIQGRGSVSGPLIDGRLAARLSFSATSRRGTLTNVSTGRDVNSQDNLGLRGQLLFTPNEDLDIILAGDWNRSDPECCAQVAVRVAPTRRPADRQFASLADASGYRLPSTNAFDRLIDPDSDLQAKQIFAGASLTFEWNLGPGTLTAISAWRSWSWDPANDRDFIGLPITTISANPSEQRQLTQEIRYAGELGERFDFVVGAFGYRQVIRNIGLQEQGSAAALWLLGPSQGSDPRLLDGLRQETSIRFANNSLAAFGRLTWKVTDRFRVEPGIRLNWDSKDADYDAVASGGLETSDPVLIARKNSILSSQAYQAKFRDFNVSGDINLSFDLARDVLLYGTFARAFKSGGVNLSGIPNDAAGNPALELATVEPEEVDHFEIGLKSQFADRAITLNLAAYQTTIRDYQATVVNAQIGVLRGYLANVEKVRVRGLEADLVARVAEGFRVTGNLAYTDAEYVSFPDAPAPLELTGGPQVVDASGGRLPGVSRWAGALSFDVDQPARLFGTEGAIVGGLDISARTGFSSNPTPSGFLNVDGYALLSARAGYRTESGWGISAWVRNLGNTQYFDFLTAAPGGSGLVVGQPGDPRTYGVTLSARF
jgi:iron complex outermembrane receptor protein